MSKHKNYRRCISCRQVTKKENLIRVVRTYPDHHIEINKGMGRSAYICFLADCIAIAQRQKKLSRALKTQVPPLIYDQLWRELSSPGEQKRANDYIPCKLKK